MSTHAGLKDVPSEGNGQRMSVTAQHADSPSRGVGCRHSDALPLAERSSRLLWGMERMEQQQQKEWAELSTEHHTALPAMAVMAAGV